MTTTQPRLVDAQGELFSSVLEGADPDTYVVIPVGALVTQLQIALRETMDREGRIRPGRTSTRLVRSLSVLGFIVNTKNQPGTNLEGGRA